MRQLAIFLMALVVPIPTLAQDACTEVAGIFDEAVEDWPDLLSTIRIKPRMAAVQIATSAGIAFHYTVDDGWSEEEQAAIVALRDTREHDYDETFTKALVPSVLHGYLTEIAVVMDVKCPDTEIADIADLSLNYPEN